MQRRELEARAVAALVRAWGAGLDAAPWQADLRAKFARIASRRTHGRALSVAELAAALARQDLRRPKAAPEAYRALAAFVLADLPR